MGVSNEFDLINKYFAPLSARAPGARGLLDDAATLSPSDGCELVVTMDTVAEGIHFLPDEVPEHIANKLIGSNLSDLAAMGAKPVGFTLSCGWPKNVASEEVQAFAASLGDWVSRYSFPLLGGDTVSLNGDGVFTVTAFGEVPTGKALFRSGARVGDKMFVSGTIGDGSLGLSAAKAELGHIPEDDLAYLADRYRTPQPRINLGCLLSGEATACIDISDGLIQDVGHIASASNVRIEISSADIPLSAAARSLVESRPELMSNILTGGDDYELAFTASDAPDNTDVPTTLIGSVVNGPAGVCVFDEDGNEITVGKTGYNHFAT